MLKILDRYIIRKFLTTFFFMLGVIMALAIVFDLSERLPEFIDRKAPLSDVAFIYYTNFIVFYGNTFSSMIVFISVIWFTAKMAQETEIIPILNSGRSFNRLLRPYFISATILTGLSLFLNQYLLPISNRVRLDFEEHFYRDELVVENYHAQLPEGRIVSYRTFVSNSQTITDFVIEQYDKAGNQVLFLKARGAIGVPKTHKWKLQDYWIRQSFPAPAGSQQFKNTAYIKPDKLTFGTTTDTVLPFRIDELAHRENLAEAMSNSDLRKFIAAEKKKGNSDVPMYEIELYQRWSYPFATYVLTMIGMAVSSRKKRGGIGASIALGLAFVAVYLFAMKVSTVAAIKVGFPAIVAVWIPNFIFACVAFVLYKLSPK